MKLFTAKNAVVIGGLALLFYGGSRAWTMQTALFGLFPVPVPNFEMIWYSIFGGLMTALGILFLPPKRRLLSTGNGGGS